MPVASETSRIQYAGNSSTVVPYGVPFYFLGNGDIRVVLADGSGVETLLVENTHYALTGAANPAGGNVTTTVAYDGAHTLTIYREPQQTQSAEFQSTGALPADTLTRGLDKLTMLVQSLSRKLGRCFRLNDKAGDVAALSEASRANTVFGFDSTGDPALRDRTALLSLLSLSGSLQGAPTAYWANDGERALKVPDFVGQLGLQLNTSVLYRSTGNSVGNWSVVQLSADSMPDKFITYPKLQDVGSTQRLLGRNSAGAGVPEEVTLSQLLDWIGGASHGDILYRGASSWERLAAGEVGLPLFSRGPGLNPTWTPPAGFPVQKATSMTNTAFVITATTPLDDTIPQSGEGVEVISLAFTPRLATSKIIVRVSTYVDGSTNNYIMGALFADSATDAFAATCVCMQSSSIAKQLTVSGVYNNASAAPKTFKCRIGTNAGTAYVNRRALAELFGTSSLLLIEIEEVAA